VSCDCDYICISRYQSVGKVKSTFEVDECSGVYLSGSLADSSSTRNQDLSSVATTFVRIYDIIAVCTSQQQCAFSTKYYGLAVSGGGGNFKYNVLKSIVSAKRAD
jgi:hypothetical protein